MRRRFAQLTARRAGRRRLAATALACVAVALLAALQRWPLWAVALATLAPLGPLLCWEAVSTYRRYHWLGVFYVLTVAQVGHLVEHVVQMTQLRVLQLPADQAHGIVGIFDTEWVHFVWNNSVALLVLLLLLRFRRNPLLWLTAAVATWHGAEHVAIIWPYLATGLRGAPGLLATGGLLAGGLPLSVLELHYYYNLLETAPLVLAFLAEGKRLYDERPHPRISRWRTTTLPA
jgi:hypothetical protein